MIKKYLLAIGFSFLLVSCAVGHIQFPFMVHHTAQKRVVNISKPCYIPPVPTYSDNADAIAAAKKTGGLLAVNILMEKGKAERDAYEHKVEVAKAICK